MFGLFFSEYRDLWLHQISLKTVKTSIQWLIVQKIIYLLCFWNFQSKINELVISQQVYLNTKFYKKKMLGNSIRPRANRVYLLNLTFSPVREGGSCSLKIFK